MRYLPTKSKGLWLGGLALAPALALAVVYLVETSAPEKIIRQAMFEPLIPPTRLREPGSLYTVEDDHSYSKVCDPDPEHLRRVIKESDSLDHKLERLTKGRFNVTGSLADSLKAAFGGTQGVSVTYSLSDVKVMEVSMDHLHELQENMLSKRYCAAVVQRLLDVKRIVCIGRQALRATTVYKVHADLTLAADVQDKISDIAQKTIESHVGSNVEVKRKDEIVGKDLLYGIRLNPLCVTMPDAPAPVPAPLPTDRPRASTRS